jgi:hypothetical protein
MKLDVLANADAVAGQAAAGDAVIGGGRLMHVSSRLGKVRLSSHRND